MGDASVTWVDTHCHLQLDERDAEELLSRADAVDWVVAPGVDAASSAAAVELSERFPGRVLATAGLHPHEAERWDSERSRIESLAPLVSAIGETGLDFYRNLAPREAQIRSFSEQVDLAIEHDLPVVVHCRDAFSEVFEILQEKEAGSRSVLHCWTGGTRWTKRFLELGVMFSYAGPVAFETGETIRLGASLVPPERALIETDTPYLAPPPYRGRPNEPAWVALVGKALSDVWGLPVTDVAAFTSENATKVFAP